MGAHLGLEVTSAAEARHPFKSAWCKFSSSAQVHLHVIQELEYVPKFIPLGFCYNRTTVLAAM